MSEASIHQGSRMKTARQKRTLDSLKAAKTRADEQKTWAWEHAAEAYAERDILAAILARVWPAHLMPHTKAKADDGSKRVTLCVHTPAGQLAFVATDAMLELLPDLETVPNHWDGAKRTTKHARMRQLAGKPA